MSQPFRFDSEDGRRLCRQILSRVLPGDSHDFQLDAITSLLDGRDVLLITATGTGKTNTFICTMHVVQELSANPAISPEGLVGRFPTNPVMLVICPTNALEAEMVCRMLAGLARRELMFN